MRVLATIAACLMLAAPAYAAQDEGSVRAALNARLLRLQNLMAECTVDKTSKPNPAFAANASVELKNGESIHWITGRQSKFERFSCLKGSARFEFDSTSKTPGNLPGAYDPLSSVQIFSPERYEQLMIATKDAKPMGMVKNTNALPMDSLVDLGVGLRMDGDTGWITPDHIANMKFSFPDDDQAVAELPLTNSKKGIALMTFSRKLGYALVSYKICGSDTPDRPAFVLTNDKFENVSGVMLPMRITESHSIWPDGKEAELTSAICDVKSYKIDDPSNIASMYTMVWPLGATVVDDRTGQNYFIKSKPRTLTDAEMAAIIAAADRKKRDDIDRARLRVDQVLGQGAVTQP